jgi:hypothetical protein
LLFAPGLAPLAAAARRGPLGAVAAALVVVVVVVRHMPPSPSSVVWCGVCVEKKSQSVPFCRPGQYHVTCKLAWELTKSNACKKKRECEKKPARFGIFFVLMAKRMPSQQSIGATYQRASLIKDTMHIAINCQAHAESTVHRCHLPTGVLDQGHHALSH